MITPQNELFCQLYTSKGPCFSKQYMSYAGAYDYEIPLDEEGKINYKSSEYMVCQNGGSRLLMKKEIQDRIKVILNERFNDVSIADARLQEILEGGEDKDSIQAIKIYNDLKGRIEKKVKLTVDRPFADLSDEELKGMLGE
jgi:hypothetical protein